MSSRCIIGPYFFKDDNGIPTTVNADRYMDMISTFFIPELQQRRIRTTDIWFQQDLATPHTCKRTQVLLEKKFGDHVISKGLWPARSPDLTPPDFYLFGYLKQKVYKERPTTLDELEASIRSHITSISRETLHSVFTNMERRVRACQRVQGGQFQHLLRVVH